MKRLAPLLILTILASLFLMQKKVSYETKESVQGEVTVEITPVKLSVKDNMVFRVTLNTHSVALDKDLKEVSVLVDDRGREYQPTSWDGGVGGHHLEGNLLFSSLKDGAKSVTLTIREIDSVDRVFSWE